MQMSSSGFKVNDVVLVGEGGHVHWVIEKLEKNGWVRLKSGMTGRVRVEREEKLKRFK